METKLEIEGMHCASCVARVEKALKKVPGVKEVAVNLLTNSAQVELEEQIDQLQLIKAVEDVGYKAKIPEQKVASLKLSVSGMHCASCVNTIETNLKKLPGIIDVSINLSLNSANIKLEQNAVPPTEIVKKIEDLGYGAEIVEEEYAAEPSFLKNKQLIDMRNRFIASLILSIPVFILAMGHMAPFDSWFPGFAKLLQDIYIFPKMKLSLFLQMILTTPVQFVISWPFYVGAWKSLKNKSAGMDVLVVLGTTAAYFYSAFSLFYPYINPDFHGEVFFETSAILLTFIFLGKYLEEVTKGRTSEAIKQLIKLRPKTARVLRDGKEEEIPIDFVKVDDICLIKPGDTVPVDGVVIEGESYVNESIITGESLPVSKAEGDILITGTVNENGFLKMRATKVGADTTLNQIIKMVEEAQSAKLPIQKLADRISAVFVPAVVLISLITFATWFTLYKTGVLSTSLLPAGFSVFLFAFMAAIAVLVISCPCALGLATPTAIMVGTGLGAKHGILIRSGEALEKAKDIQVVLLDKTGTITEGKPQISKIISLSNLNQEEILKLAASLEQGSEHSLAKAVVDSAKEAKIELQVVNQFKAHPGKGVTGLINGKMYGIGNLRFIKEQGIKLTQQAENEMKKLTDQGQTSIILFDEKNILGLIGITDTIKSSSVEAVKILRKMGIKVVMATGDNKQAAQTIAKIAGIEEVNADVLPQQKAEIVKSYQDQGYKVAFVGDGVNDAPSIAQADVGFAIGSGTDVAIETGDFVLIKDDLRDVATAIDLSKKTIRKVKMGLFWALIYNTIGIPIAAGILFIPFGFLLPAEIAGLAMALSSVSVVTNALLLKGYKSPFEKRRKSVAV